MTSCTHPRVHFYAGAVSVQGAGGTLIAITHCKHINNATTQRKQSLAAADGGGTTTIILLRGTQHQQAAEKVAVQLLYVA